MKKRFSAIVDVHLCLVRDGKILLLKRENTGYMDGYFHLPAGHMDGEEKLVDALIRESREEIGVNIRVDDVRLAHMMHHKSNNERMAFFFEVKKWGGQIKNMEPEKCSEVAWFDLKNLPQNIIPYAKTAINHYKDGMIFSHYGWN